MVAVPEGAPLPLVAALEGRAAGGGERWQDLGAAQESGWRLLANRRARPLAWIVHRTRVASPEEARALVRDDPGHAFDAASEALVPRPLAGLSADAPVPPPRSSVRTLSFADDEIRFVAETSARGLLVTSELDYPGWTALVDGEPAEVVTVNAGFRAVAIEPGRHEVVLAYRPWRSRVGLAISAASVLAILALAVVHRRRRARAAASAGASAGDAAGERA